MMAACFEVRVCPSLPVTVDLLLAGVIGRGDCIRPA